MAIHLSCTCSKQLRLKDIFAGKRIKCPACGKGLQVPGPANGTGSNGTAPHAGEESPFDFSSLADDGAPDANGEPKAALKEALQPAPKPASVPPVSEEPKPAPVAIAPALPEEAKPASGIKKGRLAAVLAIFVLLVGGLITALLMMIGGGGIGFGFGGDSDGDYADLGNKDAKLRLDEEGGGINSQFRQNGNGGGGSGGTASQAAIEAAKRKKAEEDKAAQEKLKREAAEKAAEAKRQADAAAEKLRREAAAQAAEAKRKAAEAEKLRLANLEKQKKITLANLIEEGKAALAAKKFDKAKESFDKAKSLDPKNEDVERGLNVAKKGSDKLHYEEHVASGKKSLAAKDYQKAVNELTVALQLAPGDKEAQKTLKKAQAALDKIRAAEDKKQKAAAKKEARKKADDLVKKGKAALKGKRYAEAAKLFTQAKNLVPNDVIAKSLFLQAQEEVKREARRLQKAQEAKALELKRQQEAEAKKALKKNRKEADDELKKGRKALADRDYQAAVTHLSRAQQLAPSKTTLALLQRAEKEFNKIQVAAAKKKKEEDDAKRAEQIRKLLAEAKLALNEKRLDAAEKAIKAALALSPNDPDILALDAELKALRKAAQKKAEAIAAAKRKAEEEAARQKRHADFEAKMKAGRKALTAKEFDGAIKSFQNALVVVKNIKEDKKLADQAEKAIKDAKAAKDKDTKLKLKSKLGQ